jgi:hypothetical protein
MKHRAIYSDSDTSDQQETLRAVTRRKQRAIDTDTDTSDQQDSQHRAMTRGHKKVIIESDANSKAIDSDSYTDDQPLTRRLKTKGHNKVIESDSNLEKQPETCQSDTKGKHSRGKLVTKRRVVTRKQDTSNHCRTVTRQGKEGRDNNNRVSDIDSETRVMMADQEKRDEFDSESDEIDEFDKRLLATAEKASFNASHRKSHDDDDETSAKDTQEDDDDEHIFKKTNRRKKKGKSQNQKSSSPKAKQSDIDEPRTTRQTRSQSETTSSARVNSTSRVTSSVSKTTTTSKDKTSTKSPRGKKTGLTPETCSRQLFNSDNNGELNLPRSKGKTRKETKSTDTVVQTPDKDKIWEFVDKMFDNYRKIEVSIKHSDMSTNHLWSFTNTDFLV